VPSWHTSKSQLTRTSLSCPARPLAQVLALKRAHLNQYGPIDDEKASLNRTTSLVGNEITYRDTLSSPRAAHTSGQDLRTLSPTTRMVLKWLNKDLPGYVIRILPNMIKDNASAHGARSPLKCSLMACIRSDMTCPPNEGRQPSMVVELSGTRLHPEIKPSRRTTDDLPPVHGEGSPSTTKQPLLREGVSEEEMSIIQCSPVPSAALTLPNSSLAFSMRAKPSHPSRDELKPTFPMATTQCKPEAAVSPKAEMSTDTYRMVVPGVICPTALCSALPFSHAVSPSHGEIHPSQPPDEAATTTR
jgi:hypothetical protein